jgi:perosamine synthetase
MNSSIPWWNPQLAGDEYRLVQDVLDSGYLNEGDVTARFECEVAQLLSVKHAVATTSGTAALFLALAAVGVTAGDEVLVPDITFIATANAVSLTGARPVLVDVDPQTLCIDPSKAAASITRRTRAIVPVHVSGRAADMQAIMRLARAHDLSVIEDAAEAFLSKTDGRLLGTFGAAGCFSFSPNKTITTGQGGMIVTNDDELVIRLRKLKDQGRPVRGTGGDDIHPSVGYNFKLTNLQAAVGIGQLSRLHDRLARMRQIYRRYADGLSGVPGIKLLPFATETGESPQWTDALVERRDELDGYLASRRAMCRRFWFPLHQQAPYKLPDDKFPVSSQVGPHAIWLPSAFTITDTEVDMVCHYIRELLQS